MAPLTGPSYAYFLMFLFFSTSISSVIYVYQKLTPHIGKMESFLLKIKNLILLTDEMLYLTELVYRQFLQHLIKMIKYLIFGIKKLVLITKHMIKLSLFMIITLNGKNICRIFKSYF